MNELAVQDAQASLARNEGAAVQITPAAMLQLATAQGVDPDKLQKLMDFAERWQANQARAAFNAAFMEFKGEASRIVKNIAVTDGPLKGKKYADLFAVVDALTPALSKHKLSASWRITRDETAWIEVTCTIRHVDGHCEATAMGGPPDTGSAKNAIQARASTVNYLERYTLLAATGTAATGQDDDGRGSAASGPAMAQDVYEEWLTSIKEAATDDELKSRYLGAQKSAEAAEDKGAMEGFTEAKNKRFRALHSAVRR